MSKINTLIKQLNESAEKLSIENKKTFDDITVFIRASNLKLRDAEEFLQQMLDSFLNAEQQGISIESMLGTTNVKNYCEEIVIAYKSTYNFFARSGEYMMYVGMTIVILAFLNNLNDNVNMFLFKNKALTSFSFYINFDFSLIFQFLITAPLIIAAMIWLKKSAFKEVTKIIKMKETLIIFILYLLYLCILFLISKLIGETVYFSLNIFIVLIMGVALYFIGEFLVEK